MLQCGAGVSAAVCNGVEQGYQQQCAMYNGHDDVAQQILATPTNTSTGKICKQLAKEKIGMKRR